MQLNVDNYIRVTTRCSGDHNPADAGTQGPRRIRRNIGVSRFEANVRQNGKVTAGKRRAEVPPSQKRGNRGIKGAPSGNRAGLGRDLAACLVALVVWLALVLAAIRAGSHAREGQSLWWIGAALGALAAAVALAGAMTWGRRVVQALKSPQPGRTRSDQARPDQEHADADPAPGRRRKGR